MIAIVYLANDLYSADHAVSLKQRGGLKQKVSLPSTQILKRSFGDYAVRVFLYIGIAQRHIQLRAQTQI